MSKQLQYGSVNQDRFVRSLITEATGLGIDTDAVCGRLQAELGNRWTYKGEISYAAASAVIDELKALLRDAQNKALSAKGLAWQAGQDSFEATVVDTGWKDGYVEWAAGSPELHLELADGRKARCTYTAKLRDRHGDHIVGAAVRVEGQIKPWNNASHASVKRPKITVLSEVLTEAEVFAASRAWELLRTYTVAGVRSVACCSCPNNAYTGKDSHGKFGCTHSWKGMDDYWPCTCTNTVRDGQEIPVDVDHLEAKPAAAELVEWYRSLTEGQREAAKGDRFHYGWPYDTVRHYLKGERRYDGSEYDVAYYGH
jgi:hypothetical protein